MKRAAGLLGFAVFGGPWGSGTGRQTERVQGWASTFTESPMPSRPQARPASTLQSMAGGTKKTRWLGVR